MIKKFYIYEIVCMIYNWIIVTTESIVAPHLKNFRNNCKDQAQFQFTYRKNFFDKNENKFFFFYSKIRSQLPRFLLMIEIKVLENYQLLEFFTKKNLFHDNIFRTNKFSIIKIFIFCI
jgi:hypothetical protein